MFAALFLSGRAHSFVGSCLETAAAIAASDGLRASSGIDFQRALRRASRLQVAALIVSVCSALVAARVACPHYDKCRGQSMKYTLGLNKFVDPIGFLFVVLFCKDLVSSVQTLRRYHLYKSHASLLFSCFRCDDLRRKVGVAHPGRVAKKTRKAERIGLAAQLLSVGFFTFASCAAWWFFLPVYRDQISLYTDRIRLKRGCLTEGAVMGGALVGLLLSIFSVKHLVVSRQLRREDTMQDLVKPFIESAKRHDGRWKKCTTLESVLLCAP